VDSLDIFLPFSRWVLTLRLAKSERGKKTPREGFLAHTPDSDLLTAASFEKDALACQAQSPPAPNRCFQFQKRSQLFICTNDETPSVIAVRVGNPDRSPFAIQS